MIKNMKEPTTLGSEAVRLTTSKMITLVITMLTTMLLARFRSLEEYGTYSQILLVVNLFTTLLMLGLPNSINFFLARAETEEDRSYFLSVYYTLSTVISVIIGIVLVLAIPLIEEYFHNSIIGDFYYFLALYPWTSIISSSIENVLVVYKKTSFLMIYRVIVSSINLVSVIAVQWLGWGFSEYMLIFVGINCVCAVSVYVIVFWYSSGIKICLDRSLIKSIFAFSIPMGFATVVGTLNTEMDKLLIGYLMDTEQMSIYTNAAKELPLTIVASSITAVLLPQLTRMIQRGKTKDAIKLWRYATELAFIIICLIVAGLVTYANEVMIILYSDKYLPGVPVFRIYTLNLLLRVTYFGIILNAYGETKKIFYCSIISLGLNAILNPLFYMFFGMIGPAIATFLSILLIQLLQLKMTSNITKIPFSQIFPWKQSGIVILVNVTFAIAFWEIKSILPLELYVDEVQESIVLGIVWSAIYLFFMKKRLLDRWHKLNNEGKKIE